MDQQQEAYLAMTELCRKMTQLIETRMGELENRVARIEGRQAAIYTQSQVAALTGYAVSTINNWVKNHYICVVPIPGKKTSGIPASEVDMILANKGRKKDRRA